MAPDPHPELTVAGIYLLGAVFAILVNLFTIGFFLDDWFENFSEDAKITLGVLATVLWPLTAIAYTVGIVVCGWLLIYHGSRALWNGFGELWDFVRPVREDKVRLPKAKVIK